MIDNMITEWMDKKTIRKVYDNKEEFIIIYNELKMLNCKYLKKLEDRENSFVWKFISKFKRR